MVSAGVPRRERLTQNVGLDQCRYLVENQCFHVNPSEPLLDCATAVGDDVNDLLDEDMIRSDFRVPHLHKLLDHNGNDGVELAVYLIAAGQWGKNVINGSG